jgi:hypothetical protein
MARTYSVSEREIAYSIIGISPRASSSSKVAGEDLVCEGGRGFEFAVLQAVHKVALHAESAEMMTVFF